jgi:predicted nucleic acid-binding protein
MATDYLLDAGPLGLLAHNRPVRRLPIQDWVIRELGGGSKIYISEVADYEVRRELIRLIRSGQLPASRLDRLDRLKSLCDYLAVSTSAWQRAAELWADARLQGSPAAGPASLDADVLIASQAKEVAATVVTSNAGHIGHWVNVFLWP